jgi:recombination protein RecT
VQLALRTGQYEKLNVTEVHDNQFKSFNRLTEELDADFSEEGNGKIVGYAAYLQLTTGFKKIVYWTKAEVEAHAKQYSFAYQKDYDSPWKSNFDSMAMKTVLKNMLNKWGIMSTEMQIAQTTDQKVYSDIDEGEYIDNPKEETIDVTPTAKAEEDFKKAKEEAEKAKK